MTPQITTALVLVGLAVVLNIWAYTKHIKATKIAKEANIKCESMEEVIKELEKGNKNLSESIEYIQSRATYGNARPLRYGLWMSGSYYEVYSVFCSVDKRHASNVVVKRFDFGDDPEFAELEAQELLDHLNEK